jgi:hypothetical protein
MRSAINLSDIELIIDEEPAIIESFWITETKDIYVKVQQGEHSINYSLDKLKSIIKDQRKFKFDETTQIQSIPSII